MANQIRLKRASGSDPSASDLALGEPAVRTDTGELFFKKDDGTVAKVSGGIDDGDDDTGDVPRLAFGDITSDAPPVQAFVVESDVSGAQALQSELYLQSTL